MAGPTRYRTLLVETPEYTAQFDAVVAKYSANIIGPVLRGLMWGISMSPRGYDQVTWNIRQAKSRSLGLTIPTFRIIFQIQNELEDNEHVLLLWIEEIATMEEIMDALQ